MILFPFSVVDMSKIPADVLSVPVDAVVIATTTPRMTSSLGPSTATTGQQYPTPTLPQYLLKSTTTGTTTGISTSLVYLSFELFHRIKSVLIKVKVRYLI